MSKVINITDKFSTEQASIQIGKKVYPVDNSVEAVLRFEELAQDASAKSLLFAIEGALGNKAYEEIGVAKMSVANLKVLMTALLAAMQELSYEEADARFRQ
ncbi:hypothetical protein J2Z69_000776 [Paenibacillus shirakamiensis]|uniref:Uncharacterized protein n=1 Tax=Paenibacillus shirakamiensis TaxID=1265935 RepID=A0ABS4JDF7_9BACL|nr:hypothetical protein [Paenibacillus shirakamiensis]MBP1999757.1 hypothetical protein [Paenibacillus shirakamiensis]